MNPELVYQAPALNSELDSADLKDTTIVAQPAGGKSARIFFGGLILVLLGLSWAAWQNRQLKLKLETGKNPLAVIPTPIYTASSSSTTKKTALILPLTGISEPPTTTKGGLVLSESEPEIIATPTSSPIPTTTTTRPADPILPVESNWLTKVYLDAQFPYQIRFNDAWIFHRTHGANTGSTSSEILSRVDLSKNNLSQPAAYVSAEVLSSYGQNNLENWLKKVEPELSFAAGEKFTYRGQPAVKFEQSSGNPTQKLYFLQGAYGYRLIAWETGSLSTEILAIRDSFSLH